MANLWSSSFRHALAFLLVAVAAVAATGHAAAQTYPTKPVRMIVGFPPGGSNDIVARIVAPKLGELLGVQVVVENRAGANATIATDFVAKSAPDGYTLLLGSTSALVISPYTYSKLSYDTVRDFVAVTTIAMTPEAVAVHPALPVKDMKSLIALAKLHPGKLDFASSGGGGLPHLAIELFKTLADINLQHVPFKGAGPAVTDLLGGHVQGIIMDFPAIYTQMKSGKLRGIALAAEKRISLMPDLPTSGEQGLPGLLAVNWFAIMVPAKTPAPVVARLHTSLLKAINAPDVKDRLATVGVEPFTQSSPEVFAGFLKEELVRWGKVAKSFRRTGGLTGLYLMLLAQPGRIGPLKLRNRVVMAPMGTNYSTTDGLSTERDRMYYAERARGGVGMIMTEAMVVTEFARPHHNSLCVYHDRFIPGLASIVDAIHAQGALVCGQLNHRGALLRRHVLNMEPVGPSRWKNPNTGDEVRPLAMAEIVEIQKLFVAATRRLYQAGYDGVEIHAGNGYLFQQFFTPRLNHRTDQYGGSFENRARFLIETLDRVKQALPDFPLIVRLSATEFTVGGYTEADIIELSKSLEKQGVVALDLSGGSNESPQLSKYCIQPPSFARGCLGPYAKPIKQAVTMPVLVAGRVVDPGDAEKLLTDGCADFISVGRALYADPHWCAKAFGVVKAPIRKCIACNVCFERLTLEKDVACVHNPVIGTEFEALEHAEPQLFPERKTKLPRRVLVIGAGVTGLEAARVAAARGHHVEVWEKAAQPGGQMPLAMAAPDKIEVEPVLSYRLTVLRELGVRIRTSMTVTVAAIRAYAPDFAIVATGVLPRAHPFDVSQLSGTVRVLHAWDVLRDPSLLAAARRVTIIGGGMVGAETTDLLTVQGKQCTIVEMLGTIASGMARNNRMELVERLATRGTWMLTRVKVERAVGSTLTLRADDGTVRDIDAGDALVFATGPAPVRDVLPLLEETGVDYELAGDCYRPGDFLSCLRDGWLAALSVDHRFRGAASKHEGKRQIA